MKPRLLDLFSGAGGAARGYQLAGFHVTGVDVNPQPRYAGDEFHQADAMTFPLDGFDAVHASPPCQGYSQMSACRPGLADGYDRLVDATRDRLVAWGGPWVIENVEYSGLPAQADLFGANGLLLCGAMFGARTYRHRFFESSVPVPSRDHPRHLSPSARAGHWVPGSFISVAGNCSPIALAREAMGIDWMSAAELAESIPPVYTAYIGQFLLAAVREAVSS